MTTRPTSTVLILNVLAVCGAAVFTGAMTTIGLTLGAYWKSLPPAAFLDWFGENSRLVARTIPLFVIPTVVGLVGSLRLADRGTRERTLWWAALFCLIGVGLVTAAYHLPTNAGFTDRSIPPDRVPATLDTWLTLHALRIALALSASVLGAIAMSQRFFRWRNAPQ